MGTYMAVRDSPTASLTCSPASSTLLVPVSSPVIYLNISTATTARPRSLRRSLSQRGRHGGSELRSVHFLLRAYDTSLHPSLSYLIIMLPVAFWTRTYTIIANSILPRHTLTNCGDVVVRCSVDAWEPPNPLPTPCHLSSIEVYQV